jgi:cathepsin D
MQQSPPLVVISLLRSTKQRSHQHFKSRQLALSPPETAVTLRDYTNNEFVGQIGVGTPPQTISVVFDTGSSDIWIPIDACHSCGKHVQFSTSDSSSFSTPTTKKDFVIEYGSGSVKGTVGQDAITINQIRIPDVQIGLVHEEDSTIAGFNMDGICGLGFSGLSSVTSPTLLDILLQSYPKMNKQFSIFLSSDFSGTHTTSPTSQIIFGGTNLSLLGRPNASFYYTPVVRSSNVQHQLTYWTLSLLVFEIRANDVQNDHTSSVLSSAQQSTDFFLCEYGRSCYAIVDSGTSGIGVPADYYDAVLYALTEGKDCIGLICTGVTTADFPIISFTLAPDNVFPLYPDDYLQCSGTKQLLDIDVLML